MRILFVQRSMNPPGGGNAVAAWMLHALAGAHELATLTMHPWDPAAIDRFYGTSLAHTPIVQHHPPAPLRRLDRLPGRLERLRTALLLRAARRHAGTCDLFVTADNYAAFARRGLQYLHYPAALRPDPPRWRPAVAGYYAFCDAMAGVSWDAVRRNDTLVNSKWTARELLAHHGVAARVLYPPVVDPGPGRPWRERANTFLCIARFHGSKRIERAVSIVERVRQWLPGARLHIVGSNVDGAYTRRLREAERQHAWVFVDEDLPQSTLLELMGACRYGLSAMQGEHFGMAAAELARAGCIVFVHNSGGQVETVGERRHLLWGTEDEAVERIRRVAIDEALQERLSQELRHDAERFSVERFVREFRQIVDAYTPVAINRNPGLRISSS